MKLAIMQPYLFPYIGYFQLINAVDAFVVYDDVNYIKQGWINRNNILVNNVSFLFTLPLANASSFATINSIKIDKKEYQIWVRKFLKTLEQSYTKAPFFLEVFPLVKDLLESDNEKMVELINKSLFSITKYLNIKTRIITSSDIFNNNFLKGKERVVDICIQEKATDYINLIGGQELYSKDFFSNENIDLHFIKTNEIKYQQYNDNFVPWLSIIDIMMFNSPNEINVMLNNYQLI
ncbi:WbqC family protein [Flavobacterium hydrophilum]|uniref:Glycine transferase n=1 Tax=Flavobacterium hydrophilum TaxID=2211445 RepID=A0A2V4BZM8_9FLAO|nr:WbqC family protein [Flavobacterium hydrophilum]PXY44072.1 hypothetical protein DMB68_16670 [Flavobacterium hydrophilum]